MGFAIPAAVGAGFVSPWLRPIVLVGDGAFQMSGTELSTCVRFGQTPIVIVLNNAGYATEREILDGPFNDIQNWQYEKVCGLVGGGLGQKVTTHGEFVRAIGYAMSDPHHLHVINVVLDKSDHSPAMARLAKRLAENISPKEHPRSLAAA
jgi:indolepyruvate decarboxylase